MIQRFIFSFLALSTMILTVDAATIIYLQGACSSGKSTLIRELQREDLAIVDEDALMHEAYVRAVANKFPQPFIEIQQAIAPENLYHALREKDVLFKNEITEDERSRASAHLSLIQEELDRPENLLWKQDVSKGIDLSVLQGISDALNHQKNVLLDSWYIKPARLALEYPQAKIIRVLLYCPLPQAYERFLMRNKNAAEQGNLEEKRYPRQLAGSFFSLYQISSNPSQPIQKIQKGSLEPTIEAIAKSLSGEDVLYHKPVFTFKEPSRAFFLQQASDFLSPFETDHAEELYISPREKQDLIIDNTTSGASQKICALNELLR